MIATVRCRELVKEAAISHIMSKGVTRDVADSVYNSYMDKLAVGVIGSTPTSMGAPTVGSQSITPALGQGNVGNVITPSAPMGVTTNTTPNPLHFDAAIGALNNNVEQNQQNNATKQVKNQQPQVAKPLNALQIGQGAQPAPEGMEAQASVQPTDQQLLICKAAHVFTLSRRGIHPDVALKLFDNSLNKYAHKLLSYIK